MRALSAPAPIPIFPIYSIKCDLLRRHFSTGAVLLQTPHPQTLPFCRGEMEAVPDCSFPIIFNFAPSDFPILFFCWFGVCLFGFFFFFPQVILKTPLTLPYTGSHPPPHSVYVFLFSSFRHHVHILKNIRSPPPISSSLL